LRLVRNPSDWQRRLGEDRPREDEAIFANRYMAGRIICSLTMNAMALISPGIAGAYELKSRMPNINSANVLATMSKFRMISLTYSPTYCHAFAENVTRSTFGLIA
jgi:hypothetical protein